MKQIIFIFLAMIFSAAIVAQVPQKINYQAVVRNASGDLMTDTQVGMEINIYQGSASGTLVYSETRTPTTNANGLLTIEIGGGTGFDTISWANGPYFLETKFDPQGGTDYTVTGASQLLSVPYALHAETAGSAPETDPLFNNSVAKNITAADTVRWAKDSVNTQNLSVERDQLTISSGNTITLPGGGIVPVLTNDEIVDLTPQKGDALYNSTDKVYQVYDGTVWNAFVSACWPVPTIAHAGPNQNLSDGTITTTLEGNAPETAHGTGKWTIVSGDGNGSIADDTDPHSTFTGSLNISYLLRWTISTDCSSSSSDVRIGFTSPIADYDGNVYKTAVIGNQIWMAENLKAEHYADGTPIPVITDTDNDGTSDNEWAALPDNNTDAAKAMCYYHDSASVYKDKYGALYTYAAATNGDNSGDNVQGVCPDGWHLPNTAEWNELVTFIANDGHSGKEGIALKSTDGWFNDGNGTDIYGFTALPGGDRLYFNGTFSHVGEIGFWWTSSEYIYSDRGYDRYIYYSISVVRYDQKNKSSGLSVRCVKDQ